MLLLMGKVGEIENACFLVFRALPATAVPQASKSGNMWAARDRKLGPRPKKGYARVLASTKATYLRGAAAFAGNPCCTPEASGSDVWRPLKAIARWGRRSACYVR